MRLRLALFGLVLALVTTSSPAFADKRVALLIGNGEYRNVTALANPRNDVRLLKRALDEAGFDDVKTAFDLGQRDLVKALRAFTDEASDADIALVYYSGHGMEMGGMNYLVPVDAALASDLDVPDETVALDRVLQAIDGAKRLKLVILDACRTNPFLASMKIKGAHRAIEKGLAPVEPPDADMLVAFAAKAGTPALDGEGDNSPFAAALARRLIAPGVDVQFALREVRDDVLAATRKRQEPFTYGSLGGSTIPLSKTPAAAPVPAPVQDGASAQQAAFDVAMAADTEEALDAFLANYSAGPLAKIARNERDRLIRLAALTNAPAPVVALPSPAPAAPCGGVASLASLSTRGVGVLSRNETCALNRGDVFKECTDCPEMVVIPAGSFTMGSPASESGHDTDEGPQHVVKFAKPFAVGKFDVTRDEFAAFVADAKYDAAGPGWRNPGFPQTGTHPVVNVSWNDASAYVAWLSRETGQTYRLLSEAEWEYSARGRTAPGIYPRYFFGDSESEFCLYGNNGVSDAARVNAPCASGFDHASPVGSFKPNAFGLYDMHGNVWQWVQDCYRDNYRSAPDDGSAIISGECSRRALRGGSWVNSPAYWRAASRDMKSPSNRGAIAGFRVARTLLP